MINTQASRRSGYRSEGVRSEFTGGNAIWRFLAAESTCRRVRMQLTKSNVLRMTLDSYTSNVFLGVGNGAQTSRLAGRINNSMFQGSISHDVTTSAALPQRPVSVR